MGIENKNDDPNFGPDPVLLKDALGRVYDELTEKAEQHVQQGATAEENTEGLQYEDISPETQQLEQMEHEAKLLQRQYDHNPSPELAGKISDLRVRYDKAILSRETPKNGI